MSGTAATEVTGIASELLRAWNDHDPDGAAALFSADYQGVDVGEATPRIGPEGERSGLAQYLQAFPDLSFAEDETVVQDNRVALFWTARGTHQGVLMRIPPTGRCVAVRGVSLLTVQDGKIVQALHLWDVAELLRELGLLPEL